MRNRSVGRAGDRQCDHRGTRAGQRDDVRCLRAQRLPPARAPGSLINGVPASLTSATLVAAQQALDDLRRPLVLVMFMQRFQRAGRARDAAGIEQVARVTRVFGQQQVGFPQAGDRARAQVLQVADGRRHDEQCAGRAACP